MPKTILVVEDHGDSRRLLNHYLKSVGYRVLEAENGYEAVESVKQETPDLVLMDMSLPEIDGISATRRIRELTGADDLPVICVTAHAHFYNDKALEAGCKEVLSKPIDLRNLRNTIRRYLKEE
jgi:CheY-like chemotaxis protein